MKNTVHLFVRYILAMLALSWNDQQFLQTLVATEATILRYTGGERRAPLKIRTVKLEQETPKKRKSEGK